ncbi:MAG: superoxide dismutase [Muribaculaceae bacterium]|nr:superoxide dismutase [Muribaculaceae bacterium]
MTLPDNDGKFTLIELPYFPDALEPVISADTLGFHHGKHLLTYVNNLNAMLPGSEWEGKPLEEIAAYSKDGFHNNAGQTLNHNLYFTQFTQPRDDNAPIGELADAINEQFGSFEAFCEQFEKAAVTLFGSGWAWLSADSDGSLYISQEPNAGNPIERGLRPLLTADVWEHAYYLDYQNLRAAHVKALWQIIDWNEIERHYTTLDF